jgi:branched-chain amino acid transport system ATP-binding protein
MLLGRNGAGRRRRCAPSWACGAPAAGEIRFAGRDIAGLATPDIARLGIAYVPESMAIFADLTVQENLILAARSGPPDQKRLDWIFTRFEALKRFWQLPAGNLSGGQKQMLAGGPRDRRAAPAAADRRADQGPGARRSSPT